MVLKGKGDLRVFKGVQCVLEGCCMCSKGGDVLKMLKGCSKVAKGCLNGASR